MADSTGESESVEQKYNRKGERKETKDQNGTGEIQTVYIPEGTGDAIFGFIIEKGRRFDGSSACNVPF